MTNPRHLWGLIAGEFLMCRDTNELAGPLAVSDECPSANDFPSHAANHENMACSDVVVQHIIDVRVARFVDRAEGLAKPFEDERARPAPGHGPQRV